MDRVSKYFSEVREQFNHITWADKDSLIRLTGVVLFVALIASIVFGGVDLLFTKLVEEIALR